MRDLGGPPWTPVELEQLGGPGEGSRCAAAPLSRGSAPDPALPLTWRVARRWTADRREVRTALFLGRGGGG